MQSQYNQMPESKDSMRSGLTDAVDYHIPRGIFDDEYVILD